ncbi:MAG TPA: acyl carrier protein [Chthoniobacteraceae bacterium]|nr:acyl carrier protein [Chthoniobacteraceae bacterium]
MNEGGIEQKMRAMIAGQLEVEPALVTREVSLFTEFKTDSLDILDLVMGVQREFGVKVREEDLETLRTLGDFVNYITANLAAWK